MLSNLMFENPAYKSATFFSFLLGNCGVRYVLKILANQASLATWMYETYL